MQRDLLFREVVIKALAGGDGRTPEEQAREEYCRTCRRLKPGRDCSTCSQKIEVENVNRL